jgi:hypothetical protein
MHYGRVFNIKVYKFELYWHIDVPWGLEFKDLKAARVEKWSVMYNCH